MGSIEIGEHYGDLMRLTSMPTRLAGSKSLIVVSILALATAFAQCQSGIDAPEWQRSAGGKAEFEVASVRQAQSPRYVASIPTDADDAWTDTGGLIELEGTLPSFISFAYKLPQQNNMIGNLPAWAKMQHFQISARAAGNAGKNEVRLMMQSLLRERFKLGIHFESRDMPVLIMTLDKPGQLGPQLRRHADGPPCDVVKTHSPGAPATFDMFPCHVAMAVDNADGTILAGTRDTSIQVMASFFTNVGHLPPIVDQTGIPANIDFWIVFLPERRTRAIVDATGGEATVPGISFEDAVHNQLGLRFQPSRAALQIPVVDHLEMPPEN